MNIKWQKAAETLKSGGVVVIPSDSTYGIAALVSSKEAVGKLYQIKQRADNKPSLIIVNSMDQAQKLVNFSPKALALAGKYWPGGLTMVLDSADQTLPEVIYGEGKSLAIRLPNNQNLRDLAKEVGPFILPSANLNGEKPPFKSEDVDPGILKSVDYFLDDPTDGNLPSTLIDVRGVMPLILRQGTLVIEE